MKPERDVERIAEALARVGEVLGWPGDRLYLRLEEVSEWSPAQHLDHVLRAAHRMLRGVLAIDEGEDARVRPGGSPTLAGRVVLLTGRIPRGRGQAPAEVVPDPRPVRERLRGAVEEVRTLLARVRPRAAGLARRTGTLPHPVLGAFGAAQWLRFADVHTRHHLAIVADIDRRRAVGVLAAAPAPAEPEPFGAGTP